MNIKSPILQVLQDVFVDCRRSAFVVLNPAHVTLAETLINDKENLGSHLSSKEDGFFHPMATLGCAGCTWVTPSTAGTGSVAVALVLEVWEILRKLQSLDRGWGL